VAVFMRDRPEDIGLLPYGRRPAAGPATGARPLAPLQALRYAMRHRAFWLLAGTFFVCGASTNGLIGTHLIAACHDYGIPELRSAQLLAIMGIFDILGTTASIYGWIGASHQLGASLAAFSAGAIRTMSGDYQLAFWIAGVFCVVAGTSFLTMGRRTCAAPPVGALAHS
jgi:hypothetical protein